MLFITHDLGVVAEIAHRAIVMYAGQIMEMGPVKDLFLNPLHPYTQGLISAIPDTDVTAKRERVILQGDVPSLSHLPGGCPLHTRCRYCTDKCKEVVPTLTEAAPGHMVACHMVKGE